MQDMQESNEGKEFWNKTDFCYYWDLNVKAKDLEKFIWHQLIQIVK